MIETKMPEGWVEVRLGAVAEVNPPPRDSSGFSDKQPVGFIPMAGVDAASGLVAEVEERPFGEVRGKSFRTFLEGDVLFAKITPSMENGKAAIVPSIPGNIGYGSTEFHVLRPRPGIDRRYLWQLIRTPWFRAEAKRHMTGSVGQLRVPTDYLRAVAIPLPPAAEQQRIAECLEEVGELRTSIGGDLHAAQLNLERLRRGVLAAACSGRLTEDWRDAHPNASAAPFVAKLLEARQDCNDRRKPSSASRGIDSGQMKVPSSWKRVRLGDLLDVTTGATPLRKNKAFYEDGTVPWVTSGAVNDGTVTEATELITACALKETNVKVFPKGTLLVAMYGEGQTRGRIAELAIEAGTNQALAAILFSRDTAPIRPFIRLFFENNYQRIRAKSAGGVQPNLNLGMIQDTMLPLPPPEEQAELVERARKALAVAEGLAAMVKRADENLDRLYRTTLLKAFRGGLVRTEAELATEAKVDFESARELVESLTEDI